MPAIQTLRSVRTIAAMPSRASPLPQGGGAGKPWIQLVMHYLWELACLRCRRLGLPGHRGDAIASRLAPTGSGRIVQAENLCHWRPFFTGQGPGRGLLDANVALRTRIPPNAVSIHRYATDQFCIRTSQADGAVWGISARDRDSTDAEGEALAPSPGRRRTLGFSLSLGPSNETSKSGSADGAGDNREHEDQQCSQ